MEKTKKGLGVRMWFFLILIGFAGQLAWALENMYLNTYITYLNFSAPAGQNFEYSLDIALTTAFSAIVATLTTIFMGALTDKIGHKKFFISGGYLLWGIATACFGLFNVNSTSKILPIAMASSLAALFVIVLDCIMTFFGSTSNDAAFNSYITKNIEKENRGKAEGVLQILPLIAMLFLFVGLNSLTTDSSSGVHDARWDLFFYIVGGFVFIMGIVSFFLIPKEKEEKSEKTYLSHLVEGFRPSVIQKNKNLYLVLLIYFLYACATQVFFPYLMVYVERTCKISNTGSGFLTPFALLMAIALLGGSLLSVFFGILSDKLGRDKLILPSLGIFALGILLMFFVPQIASDGGRLGYGIVSGTVLILGYVGVPTILNAIVRDDIPQGEEGSYMGVRMLFVVALPMCIGPFIGNALNASTGEQYANEFGDVSSVPSKYGYLVGLGVLLLSLIPSYFYFREVRKQHVAKQ